MAGLRRAAVTLAVLAALALALSGPGTRLGLWQWNVGLVMFGLAGLLSVVAAIAAAIGRRFRLSALCAALAVMPLVSLLQALSAPRTNDASSERVLAGTAEASFSKALAAAEAMGWEIVRSERKTGQIDAVATTFWFGFKDDVVVRVGAAGTGSRIEVRSKSRVGRGDSGSNSRRIQAFFKRLD